MDARNSANGSEPAAMNAFAPFSEMMNHSRACFEKSLAAMRGETVELLNRVHDHNGEMLAEYQGGAPNLTKLINAHEKWFVDMSREMFEATMRLHETARQIMAESLENVGQTMRNGIAQAAQEAEDRGARVMRATREAADHIN
jgi:hypothetical protein